MKRNKTIKWISLLLAVALGCSFFSGCEGASDKPLAGVKDPAAQEEKVLIFNADNVAPITGQKFQYVQNSSPATSVAVADRSSTALTGAAIPPVMQEYGVEKLVQIADSRTVYVPIAYTAAQITEFKEQGYTHLSFYFLVEGTTWEVENNCHYVGAISGLLKRSNKTEIQLRIDQPTVYDVKITIDDLIAEMTDTTDDTKEFATLEEQKVLLCARFWDTALNFHSLYLSDMYLTKETDFVVRTKPALTPGAYV